MTRLTLGDEGEFCAWIEVDYEERECLQVVKTDCGRTVECWVESEVGKRFSVHWTDRSKSHAPSEEITGTLYIDGVECKSVFSKTGRRSPISGRLVRDPDDKEKEDEQCRVMKKMRTSATTSRYFTFARIALTDDDKYLDATSCLEQRGEIRLTINRFTHDWVSPIRVDNDRTYLNRPFPGAEKIHETAIKKAHSTHMVKLSKDKVEHRPLKVLHGAFSDPIATFIFRYAAKSQLIAKGVIPNRMQSTSSSSSTTTSPPQSPSKRRRLDMYEIGERMRMARISQLVMPPTVGHSDEAGYAKPKEKTRHSMAYGAKVVGLTVTPDDAMEGSPRKKKKCTHCSGDDDNPLVRRKEVEVIDLTLD